LLLFHEDPRTMDEEMLIVHRPLHFTEAIAHMEIHAHRPYAFPPSATARCAFLYRTKTLRASKPKFPAITGRLTKADGRRVAATTELINNGICFLFEELRYELNDVERDCC